jgi:hypothetical protein
LGDGQDPCPKVVIAELIVCIASFWGVESHNNVSDIG